MSVDAAATVALALVQDGFRVGLGSGRAAAAFIAGLGARVHAGLDVVGVPTSEASARLARSCGIPLVELGPERLDLVVDGADEVTPALDLVKGWGGALVRERIVAAASLRQVIVVGPEKLVDRLGARGRIPVEVIPFARGSVLRELLALGLVPTVRANGRHPVLGDNGNLTIDCAPPQPLDPPEARALEAAILGIAGVVDTGLFLQTAERVIVGHADGRVEVLFRKPG